MVGHRRGSSQRRVREVAFESRSPDPLTVSLTRGLPSPSAAYFRRAPPSPGLRNRHRRSPSPMLSSSPDMEEYGSMEEGVSPNPAMASSEVEVLSEVAVGSRFSPLLVLSRLAPKVSVEFEGSFSVASSGLSTLSPTTTVLLCQDSIAAVIHEDDRMKLVRSESVCSSSSPSLDSPSSVPAGVRLVVADSDGEQEGGSSMGGDELPRCSISSPTKGGCPAVTDGSWLEVAGGDGVMGGVEMPNAMVSFLCPSLHIRPASPVCGQSSLDEGLDDVAGSVVLEQVVGGARPVA
ncbi:hypothetical protein Dimus_029158, partial [Dionaea muscipula]